MPGHIRNRGKRADGSTRWQARWTHPNNSTIRKDKTFRDKDVAKRWIVRMDAEAHGAMFSQPTNPEPSRPFSEIVAVWKETCWTGLQPQTRARYEETLRHHLLPEFGNTPVHEITRERVRLYFARLIAARKPDKDGKPTDKPRLSPGSIRKIHTAFSAAMREALDMGLVPSNPCARVRGLPPVKPKGQIALTPDELMTVADAMDRVCAKRRGKRFADHPGYKLPVLLTGYTGLRAGELWALRRCDVDVLHGKLHIRRAVKDAEATDPNERFGPPKNGKPRTISLPKFLRAMLAEHLERPSSGGNGPEALLFVSVQAGELVYHENFRSRYWTAAVKVLPAERRPRFHDLRHTAASIYASQPNTSLIQLKDRLGHASIKTTVDLYSHLYDNHDDAAMDALDAVYEQSQNSNVTALRK
jgi:integrase